VNDLPQRDILERQRSDNVIIAATAVAATSPV
jgi:hypothetical protein